MSMQPLQYYRVPLPGTESQASFMPTAQPQAMGVLPANMPRVAIPTVANVAPRPMRPLTQDEIAIVNYRLEQARPIKKRGLDIPMTNLIASSQKQSLLGAFHGGLIAWAVSSILMDTIYKTSSAATRTMTMVLSIILAAGLTGLKRSKKTEAQNEFAINMLRHGVTQYDSIPKNIGINHSIWKQLNGIG